MIYNTLFALFLLISWDNFKILAKSLKNNTKELFTKLWSQGLGNRNCLRYENKENPNILLSKGLFIFDKSYQIYPTWSLIMRESCKTLFLWGFMCITVFSMWKSLHVLQNFPIKMMACAIYTHLFFLLLTLSFSAVNPNYYKTILYKLTFNCYCFTQTETKYVVIMFEV